MAQEKDENITKTISPSLSGNWLVTLGTLPQDSPYSTYTAYGRSHESSEFKIELQANSSDVKGIFEWTLPGPHYCRTIPPSDIDGVKLLGTVNGSNLELEILDGRELYKQFREMEDRVRKVCNDYNPNESYNYIGTPHLARNDFSYKTALEIYLNLADELQAIAKNHSTGTGAKMVGLIKNDAEIEGSFVFDPKSGKKASMCAAVYYPGRTFTMKRVEKFARPIWKEDEKHAEVFDGIVSGLEYKRLAADCLNNAANCLASLGRRKEAIVQYNKAIDLLKEHKNEEVLTKWIRENLKMITKIEDRVYPMETRKASEIDSKSFNDAKVRLSWSGGSFAMLLPAGD